MHLQKHKVKASSRSYVHCHLSWAKKLLLTCSQVVKLLLKWGSGCISGSGFHTFLLLEVSVWPQMFLLIFIPWPDPAGLQAGSPINHSIAWLWMRSLGDPDRPLSLSPHCKMCSGDGSLEAFALSYIRFCELSHREGLQCGRLSTQFSADLLVSFLSLCSFSYMTNPVAASVFSPQSFSQEYHRSPYG